MFYYFKKGKNATEMQKKKIVQYGGGAVTEQMCQKWFVKFHVGNFPLDDAPWSGRPIAADSEHIKTWEQSMHTYVGDSWHTQDIQIKCWK